jgi:type VI secretion system protein ImpH
MVAADLSLTGPSGPLPYSYTELLLERAQERDHSMAAFLDLFHHRLLSLFYRAWERTRPALALERAQDESHSSRNGQAGVQDEFSAYLFALMGLGMPALRHRHDFPDEALLFYVGLFAQQHRSAATLEAFLRDFFGLPIEVVTFVEQRLRLTPTDRSRLGAPGGNNRLGVDLIVGDRPRDVAGKFRLRIGPLSLGRLRELSPEGPLFRRVVQMTRLFAGSSLTFDVQFVLRAKDVPECRLVSARGAGTTLGRDSWVKGLGRVKDVGDIILAPGV